MVKILNLNFLNFSSNRPTGPIRSSSRHVRPQLCLSLCPFSCYFFAWKNWCGSSLVKELVWSVGHVWSPKNREVFRNTGFILPPPPLRKNSTQLSNHIEQQLQWGAPGSWHWNGSVPGMGWEEPVPLLAILNTAVQSIDLQVNRSGTGSWHQKGQPFCPFWRHGAGAAPPVTELPCIR